MTFGAKLRMIRQQFGERRGDRIDQVEMAQLLEVEKPTYAAWESGRAKPRDLVRLAVKVGEVTGADPSWLLGLTPSDLGERTMRR